MQTSQQLVSSFYLAYYGRPADVNGLAYWTQQLDKSGGNLSDIVDAFANSAESTANFGGLTAPQHISLLYQQLLSRSPEQAGAAYWLGEVDAGRITLAKMAISLYEGALGSDTTTVQVRQQVADQFTAALATNGTGYSGLAAIEAARLVIQAANANTSAADITGLASAGVALATSATSNPAVITALIGANGHLIDLLATPVGTANPLALVNLVNTIVTAAAGNAASLTTLLGTGTLTDVITTLPAGTTLTSLDATITGGGLVAGGVVVNPPVEPPDNGGGGGPAPAVFEVLVDTNGVVTFKNGSGDITVSIADDGTTATFSRGGVAATTKHTLNTDTKITVAADQKFTATAAVVNMRTIDGAGTVAVTGLDTVSGANANLSNITADSVTAAVTTVAGTSVTLNTAQLGKAAITVSGDGEFHLGFSSVGTASFDVGANATLTCFASANNSAPQLSGATITGTGKVNINGVQSATDFSKFATTLTVKASISSGTVVVDAAAALAVDEFVVGTGGGTGVELQLTAEQAVGKTINGAGKLTVSGSDGNQTLDVKTTGANSITGGKGADAITLGTNTGTDTIVVKAGAVTSSNYSATVAFGDLSTAVAGNTLKVTIDSEVLLSTYDGTTWGAFLNSQSQDGKPIQVGSLTGPDAQGNVVLTKAGSFHISTSAKSLGAVTQPTGSLVTGSMATAAVGAGYAAEVNFGTLTGAAADNTLKVVIDNHTYTATYDGTAWSGFDGKDFDGTLTLDPATGKVTVLNATATEAFIVNSAASSVGAATHPQDSAITGAANLAAQGIPQGFTATVAFGTLGTPVGGNTLSVTIGTETFVSAYGSGAWSAFAFTGTGTATFTGMLELPDGSGNVLVTDTAATQAFTISAAKSVGALEVPSAAIASANNQAAEAVITGFAAEVDFINVTTGVVEGNTLVVVVGTQTYTATYTGSAWGTFTGGDATYTVTLDGAKAKVGGAAAFNVASATKSVGTSTQPTSDTVTAPTVSAAPTAGFAAEVVFDTLETAVTGNTLKVVIGTETFTSTFDGQNWGAFNTGTIFTGMLTLDSATGKVKVVDAVASSAFTIASATKSLGALVQPAETSLTGSTAAPVTGQGFAAEVDFGTLTSAAAGNILAVVIGGETFASTYDGTNWSTFKSGTTSTFTGTLTLNPETGKVTVADTTVSSAFTITSAAKSVGAATQPKYVAIDSTVRQAEAQDVTKIASDSYLTATVADAYDTITGFDLAVDKLDLDATYLLNGNNFGDTGINVASGIVNVNVSGIVGSQTTAVLDVLQLLANSVGTKSVAAYVFEGNTYILQTDNVVGLSETDVVIKLAGVEVTSLSTILAGIG